VKEYSSKPEHISFSFGQNWLNYVARELTEKRVQVAIRSFRKFAAVEDLKDQAFLDIGCGSGLYSLTAYRLGASRIVSIDVDAASVQATNSVRRSAGSPSNWLIMQHDILRRNLEGELGQAEFVYCWGVLHHTGHMYKALENTCRLVATDGLLYLAVYNYYWLSPVWLRIKRAYNRLPSPFQKLMVYLYGFVSLLNRLGHGKNPASFLRNYSATSRGMSFRLDLVDWLGGLPYEFATPEQIIDFVRPLGFDLRNIDTVRTHGCNQFLFHRVH